MEPEISSKLLDELLRAANESAVEICGILRGDGGCITVAQPAPIVAADPARHFEIDPAALFAALRDARRGGAAVLGWYHSHPSGVAIPSATDAACASPDGSLWLIVAGQAARLWMAQRGDAGQVAFKEVLLDIR